MSRVYGDGCGLDMAWVSVLVLVLKSVFAMEGEKEQTYLPCCLEGNLWGSLQWVESLERDL